MPPRVPSRNEGITTSSDMGHVLEFRRTSRQHLPSRFAREKPLSPGASQSLKFKDKDKVNKAENSVRPPYADVPLEFVKNVDNGYFVQAKPSGMQQLSDQATNSVSKEEELVKYMSKVPAYLQRGRELQGNVLNFGVLDWGRLEKWTHKQSQTSASCSTAIGGSSIPSTLMENQGLVPQKEQPCRSRLHSVDKVGLSPVIRPLKGKAISQLDMATSDKYFGDKKQEFFRKDKSQRENADLKSAKGKGKDEKQVMQRKDKSPIRDGEDLKSAKGKEKCLSHDSSFATATVSSSLSNHNHEISRNSNKKISYDGAEPQNCPENLEGLALDSLADHCTGKNESIVLLLPKDFSRPETSEVCQRASVSGKSTQHNWGSFSDIFSVDEIHPYESSSDIPQSGPSDCTAETETELDSELDNLIKAQGVELPVNTTDMSSQSNEEMEATISTNLKVSGCLDPSATRFSVEVNRDCSTHQRFGFGLARMTRSISFKEGSVHPQLRSAYATAKSGPAKPDCSAAFEPLTRNKEKTNGRAKASPLRKLLDPLLKSKVANHMKEQPIDLRVKPLIPVHVAEDEKREESTIKARLHLTVKSGLPLFKFVVETNDQILASTVKSLHTFDKDDISLLYTFYSVHKLRKKRGVWKNQKVKRCAFAYDVIGQMKVSKPHLPSWSEKKSAERYMVKESILYSVDVSKADAATSGFMTSRELAAIVVNMLLKTRKDGSAYSEFYPHEGFSDFEDEKLGQIVVILPGGDHSVPHEGGPSSLINRWRSEGSCDCGGWDVGCKLRILTDQEQERKVLTESRSQSMQVRCKLYDQGEANQSVPFFRLVPFRDGLFSVEFDAKISSLQAFSTCVAIINSQKPAHPWVATDQVESRQEGGRAMACMVSQGGGPEIHSPHPPLSPIGRV